MVRDGADRARWDDKRVMVLNGGGCCSGTRPDGLLDRLMAYVNMVRLGLISLWFLASGLHILIPFAPLIRFTPTCHLSA